MTLPNEILKLTDGNGKFLSAVYETETGFTVVAANSLLNKIITGKGRIHRDCAETIAENAAENNGKFVGDK